MLFNSHIFIFLFLPITLFGFYILRKSDSGKLAILWLVLTSLIFYGWWNPIYLVLLIFSMGFNFIVGLKLTKNKNKTFLFFGVLINLLLLGYFKYTNFFIDYLNFLFETQYNLEKIILPLAISFFTFQQIAYLIDAFRQETQEYSLLHYALFVTFFPQLIAGPIVHHKEMLPQFNNKYLGVKWQENISIGISIFIIGLFKKVYLADGISIYASPVFDAAEAGTFLTFFEAWGGAIAYTLQLYFDFSGYSDMAIGIARMFGIKLPVNFNSPYKSTSIIEFWRRWHITLSRFLRDYLYFSLGGNKKGPTRKSINLLFTMLLGGLWHGAGWTFVIWGGLHGFFLLVNHSWKAIKPKNFNLSPFIGWLITIILVIISWVPFRAETLTGTKNILLAMFGYNGVSIPQKYYPALDFLRLNEYLSAYGVTFSNMNYFTGGKQIAMGLALLAICLILPNTQEFFSMRKNSQYLQWSPSKRMAWIFSFLMCVALSKMSEVSEFLYFQF